MAFDAYKLTYQLVVVDSIPMCIFLFVMEFNFHIKSYHFTVDKTVLNYFM